MSIHSDAEAQVASLIAYLDIPVGMSLGRYMETHSSDGNVQRIREIARDCTGSESGYDNWRIVGVGNDQNGSGMYGCMIDNDRGDAFISFRGSEGDQLIEDWGAADFGLLNNAQTWQQSQAEEFTRRMYEEFGGQYGNYVFTGHSLGGNLAISAAINAPKGMRDNIIQVIGFDSPGFSDEYMATHAAGIREMEGRITHYQWSAIGAIFETPGTNRTVNVRDMGNCFTRHDLRNLDTGTGTVTDRPGGMTPDELAIKAASNTMEYTGPFNIFSWGGLTSVVMGISGLADIVNRVKSIGQHMEVTTSSSSESMGHFEVTISAVNALEDRYVEIENSLRQAQTAIDDVHGRIKYNSVVGWLIKNRLKSESTRVTALADTLRKYREVLQNAASTYQKADSDASAAYAGLGASIYGNEGGAVVTTNSGANSSGSEWTSNSGAPRYNLPDYVYRNVAPGPDGIYGPIVYWRDGRYGSVAEWNLTGEMSCTYYTLRKLNERGISFPCVGGPGNGGTWMNYFDTESGTPYSMAGDGALNELFTSNTLPQDNIVVSCSGITDEGHVFLIDHVFRDENGQIMCTFSDNYPPIYNDLNGTNPPITISLDELNSRYGIYGAAILGATDANY